MKFQVEIYKKVIQICKDSDIEITFTYIEGCHRLPLGRNATNTVTVKFVNRKNSKAILQVKKSSILKVKLLQPIVCILTKLSLGKV